MAALLYPKTPEKCVIEYSDDVLQSFGSPTISRTPLTARKTALGSAARVNTPSRLRTTTPSRLRETGSFGSSAEISSSSGSSSTLSSGRPSIVSLPTTATATTASSSTMSGNWCLEGFSMSKPLGKGKFGNVYHAKQRGSNVPVALKVLFKAQMQNEMAQRMLKREVEIQYRLHHENLLRLYGYFQDTKNVYLILEFAEGGEYTKYLAQHTHDMTEERCHQHMQQIAAGIAFMHQRHVMHRDIKPENILIDKEGHLKLADFGSSVHMPPLPLSSSSSSATPMRRYTMCGTPEYLAPEVIRCAGHDHAVDIWALGVLMFEIMFKCTPFVDMTASPTILPPQPSRKREREPSLDGTATSMMTTATTATATTATTAVMDAGDEGEDENRQRRQLYHRILSFTDGRLSFTEAQQWCQRKYGLMPAASPLYCQQILSLLRSEARHRPTAHGVFTMLSNGSTTALR